MRQSSTGSEGYGSARNDKELGLYGHGDSVVSGARRAIHAFMHFGRLEFLQIRSRGHSED